MTLFISGVLIALVISALCSVMEATLLSLTPAQVANISQRRPKIGRIWQGFKNDVERPIAVILLLNTTAHTVGATLAGAQFGVVFGEKHLWIFATVFTFVMLQFTEILAKTMGVRFNVALSILIAHPLKMMTAVLGPVLWVILRINRPFEGRRRSEVDTTAATIEEISALAGLARICRQISPHQERIIKSASRLSDLEVSQIQIPLADVAWIDSSQSLDEAIETARRHLHTRFPVCKNGDINSVVGYVNVKEMMLLATGSPDLNRQARLPIRAIHRVAASDFAADVLTKFVRDRVHVAIVQDGQGRTQGLVTFEDIVEELLGDIRDEFDRLPRLIHAVEDGVWMVGGGVMLSDLVEVTACEISYRHDAPLAVWLEERVEKPIKPGSHFEQHGFRFMARRLRRGSLYECEVRRLEDANASESGDSINSAKSVDSPHADGL